MRETEKRIRMYQAQLPFAKEKVIASLLIFAFSIAMVAMTTFAWTTLSVAPEVSGATTIITSNGNLEIALAGSYDIVYETVQKKDADGNLMFDDKGNPVMENVLDGNGEPIVKEIKPVPPSASAVGDSLLGTSNRNQTWGNLINLSDPSYGLDQIILRPATLNTSGSLAKKPFVSAAYGPDGRVDHTNNSEFAYTQYLEIANGEYGFLKSDLPGVKAVSSVLAQPTHIESNLGLYYTEMLTDTIPVTIFETARKNLHSIVADMDLSTSQSSPLSGLMSVYLNGILYKNLTETEPSNWTLPDSWKNSGKNTYAPAACDRKDMEEILVVMQNLETGVIDILGEGYAELFYLYQMDTYIDREAYDKMENPEENFKWPSDWKKYAEDKNGYITQAGIDEMIATAPGLIEAMIAKRTEQSDKDALSDFKAKVESYGTIRSKLKSSINNLKTELEEGDEIFWYEVEKDVNTLVNIQTTVINGKTLSEWFASLSANIGELPGMLKNSADKNNAVVHDGVIRDIDAMLFSNEGGIHMQKVSVLVEIGAIKHRAGSYSGMLALAGISGDQTIYANIKTNAPSKDANNQWNPSVTAEALIGATNTLDTGYVVYSYKALDTYGLAIDFWLRTNVPGASLILEGEVEFEEKDVTKTLADGTVVTLYLANIKRTTAEDGKNPEILDLTDVLIYSMKDENGNDAWYYEDSGAIVAEIENIYGELVEGEEEPPVIGTITTEIQGTPKKKTEKIAIGYSAGNRIWKDEDFPLGVDPQYSTTQGSGSCYTFYADPSELNTVLGALERMRVAFVDGSGKLLAMAKLDTQYCFSEYGRHLVPLVIYSGGETTVTDPISGQETTYTTITNMQTNVPTMISALVYLEGTSLENKDVLDVSDIQGQFNIQFSTVYDEKALKDEVLMKESITLAASITDKSIDEDKAEYIKTVNATITGLKSSTDAEGNKIWPSVTANFTRKISSTQGSVYFPAPLSFSTSDGTQWSCDFKFTTPGTYILRSLTIDGQERMLDEPLEFTIEGFKIDSLQSGHGQKYTYMTAGSYFNDTFTLDIAASSAFADKMPKSIKGVFTNEDNVNVDLKFTKTEEKDGKAKWTANVTFNASGTYTLRYLLLDGEYYELTNPFIREVVLGLQTKVWLTAPKDFSEDEEYSYSSAQNLHKFFFINPLAKHEFAVSLEIYDETGKEIRQLGGTTGVELVYGTIRAKLKWNGSTDNYTGASLTLNSPGVYSFTKVDIPMESGTQSVTATLGAPTVRIMSKDPYTYYHEQTKASTNEFNAILAPNPDKTAAPRVELNFDSAASASVFGKFKFTKANGDVEYIILKAEHNDGKDTDNTFAFYLPKDENSSYMDGFYQLMEVKFTNVMGPNQHFYQSDVDLSTQDADYFDNETKDTDFVTISFTEEEQTAMKIKVIKTVYIQDNVGKENGANTIYGNKETTPFMTQHTVNDIVFTVTDFTGAPLDASVNITYLMLGGKSQSYGGYTYAGWETDKSSLDLMGHVIGTKADGSSYTVDAFNISTAGEYRLYATIVVGDQTINYTVSTLLKVYSMKPTVKITGATPTGSVPTKITWTKKSELWGAIQYLSYSYSENKTYSLNEAGNTVTVYAKAKDTGSTGDAGFEQPTLTFVASGIDSSTTASFTVPNKNDSNKTIAVALNGTTEKTYMLGSIKKVYEKKLTGVTYTVYGYVGHGTVEINEITLTKDGVNYFVTLDDKITINNPSSVDKTS